MVQIIHERSTYTGTNAERLTTSPARDGYSFFTTDTKNFYIWDGAAWNTIGGVAALGLNDLSDVSLAGVSDGKVLIYDGGTGFWENSNPSFKDSIFSIYDEGDPTKLIQFQVSGVTTGTTRTYIAPDNNGTITLRETTPGNTEIPFWSSGNGWLDFSPNFTWDGSTFTTAVSSSTTTTPQVLIEQGSTGDSILQLRLSSGIGGAIVTSWNFQIDNDDSDKLKIYSNSLSTAAPAVSITTAGRVTIGDDISPGMFSVIGTSDIIQLIIRANSTQTQDILRIQDGTPSTLHYINSSGIWIANNSIRMANNVGILGTDTGGNGRNLFKIDGSDILIMGPTASSVVGVQFHAGAADIPLYLVDDKTGIGGITVPDTKLHYDGAFTLQEISSTPTAPASADRLRWYMKGDKFIFQFYDSGTVRYKYLDLTGTGVTWVHTTTAP